MLMLLALVSFFIIMIFLYSYPSDDMPEVRYTGSVEGGKANISSIDILDYLEDYLKETGGEQLVATYLGNHMDISGKNLKELVKKIIKEGDITSITEFLEKTRLTYAAFIPDEYKPVIYSSDIEYDPDSLDYDKLLVECRRVSRELGYHDYTEHRFRKILKNNISSWISFKIKKGKLSEKPEQLLKEVKKNARKVLEIDKYVIRVYVSNYIECHLMEEDDKYREIKKIISEVLSLSIPAYIENYSDLLRFLREKSKYDYVYRRPPPPPPTYYAQPTYPEYKPLTELEQLAAEYGLDLDVLKDYVALYPDIPPKEIIKQIIERSGAGEGDDLNQLARTLYSRIQGGYDDLTFD